MSEFTIISIDDSRKEKKDWTRQRFTTWREVTEIDFVNGKDPEELRKAKKKWNNVDTPGPFKAGEFGIFYSVLNCFEYGAANDGILYFEDDAHPLANFQEKIDYYLDHLPRRMDLFACWSPLNQTGDYAGISGFNAVGEPHYEPHKGSIFDYGHEEMCGLWQGYGNVSMYFTKRGCQRMLEHIHEKGFYSPIDCLICIAAHTNVINGYALKPGVQELISYDWEAPTTIHKSRWGHITELMKEEKE